MEKSVIVEEVYKKQLVEIEEKNMNLITENTRLTEEINSSAELINELTSQMEELTKDFTAKLDEQIKLNRQYSNELSMNEAKVYANELISEKVHLRAYSKELLECKDKEAVNHVVNLIERVSPFKSLFENVVYNKDLTTERGINTIEVIKEHFGIPGDDKPKADTVYEQKLSGVDKEVEDDS